MKLPVMQVLLILAGLLVWLPQVSTAALSDHVALILIYQSIDYADPDDETDTSYEFSFFLYADETVKQVDVQCPGTSGAGKQFTVTQTGQREGEERTLYAYDEAMGKYLFDFYADYHNTDLSVLDPYGDGTYAITVTFVDDSTDTTAIQFLQADQTTPIPMAATVPKFSFPENNASLPGGRPVVFTWDESSIDPQAAMLGISCKRPETHVDYPEFSESFPTANDPGSASFDLGAGIWDVHFVGAYLVTDDSGDTQQHGIPYEIGKGASTDYQITIAPPNFLPVFLLLLE